MRQWFTVTATSYFDRINRNSIALAMREARGETGERTVKAPTRKSEATIIAERLVRETNWLPKGIRIKPVIPAVGAGLADGKADGTDKPNSEERGGFADADGDEDDEGFAAAAE